MKYLKIIFTVIVLVIFSCNKDPKIEEGYIDIDSTSIYYKTIGSGEPILFVHGGPGLSHNYFRPYLDGLSSNYQVVYYDQRGTGLSISPIDSTSITLDKFIEDVETLRKHFKIEKLNLAGHSWGGVLSLYYAVKYPQNLNSLVLFGTACSMNMLHQFTKNLRNKRPEIEADMLDSLANTEEYINSNPQAYDEFFKLYLKPYFKNQALSNKINITFNENSASNIWRVNRLIFSLLGNFNLESSLEVIECPTLILHGTDDLFPLEASEMMYTNIPNSELVIFENSGHFMYIEEEDKFMSVVSDFLESL